MSLNDVLMHYGDISAFSKEVEGHKADFDDLLSDLDKLASALEGAWQGYAAQEFREAFEALRPQLKSFSELLAAYQIEINHAVADSCSVQNQNANRIDRNLSLR